MFNYLFLSLATGLALVVASRMLFRKKWDPNGWVRRIKEPCVIHDTELSTLALLYNGWK
jgi:hypothetical protein